MSIRSLLERERLMKSGVLESLIVWAKENLENFNWSAPDSGQIVSKMLKH